MKKSLLHILLLSFVLSPLAACSTHKAHLEYKDFREQGVAIRSSTFQGEDLGVVSGDDGGALWSGCTDRARESVAELITNARARGANAIGNIKWDASDSSEPECKREWGYLLLFPLVLTPLFMNTRVEGVAYKATTLAENMIPLPENDEEKEAMITAIVGQ